MKILITGASGFIGGFIVEKALDKGYEVWAGIRKTSSREYLQDSRIQFIDLCFADVEQLKNQLEEFRALHGRWNYIVHNAGITKSIHLTDYEKVNYSYTKNFADALISCQMQPRTFILMSSLSVWGPVRDDAMTPIHLQDIPQTNTFYGRSKLMAGKYVCSLPNFPYVILHPTGVYGPRDKDYFLMFKSIKQGMNFIAGRKQQFITFIYVQDLVDAIFLTIEKNVTNASYLLSDGNSYTSSDFSRLIQRELGKKRVIRLTVPLFVLKIVSYINEKLLALSGKSGTLNRDKYHILAQRNWLCDISQTQTGLGFSPKYDLVHGVKETAAWYKNAHWL
ncbi:MAG: NAD(P)-dependent oxidoreductase [Bacteroidales bacterium]|jgi:nucleoside-diphosphate-sugar epimerase|nr:NAD(P)-dependent oxidoreductase [Bacteroidales bacterium]